MLPGIRLSGKNKEFKNRRRIGGDNDDYQNFFPKTTKVKPGYKKQTETLVTKLSAQEFAEP